jgi:hypothetical protein
MTEMAITVALASTAILEGHPIPMQLKSETNVRLRV